MTDFGRLVGKISSAVVMHLHTLYAVAISEPNLSKVKCLFSLQSFGI